MCYFKTTRNGYIVSVSASDRHDVGNIEKEEYDALVLMIKNRPASPDGYDYRLKENLEWELYELPPVEEEPTAEDYENALGVFGV